MSKHITLDKKNTFVPPLTDEEIQFLRHINNTLMASNDSAVVKQYKPVLDRIKRAVCLYHGITKEQLEGPCRLKHFVKARIDYSHLAMKHGSKKFSLTTIARFINRDHTSVMHHLYNHQPGDIDSIEKLMDA